jgi:uncharacterized protein YbjQ (UPF0145 family)
MGKHKKNDLTAEHAQAVSDAIMRDFVGGHLDGYWDGRDATDKAMMVVKEAADQIGGLSTIAYSLASAEIAKGGKNDRQSCCALGPRACSVVELGL